ncbi:MAG: hypothetical protein JWL60_835 [Gemmatimonadetes bacterium]|jgi:hypothetical protein|nr:hypothetical protein [Gemmatimonadota bacterium]
MSRLALAAASAALLALAVPASAQRPPAVTPDTSAARTAADSAVRDLERALTSLATSVQRIVTETANRPEVRLAAVQVAGRAVSLAQQALVENTSEIERLLAEATRVLAKAEQSQTARTPAPKP